MIQIEDISGINKWSLIINETDYSSRFIVRNNVQYKIVFDNLRSLFYPSEISKTIKI